VWHRFKVGSFKGSIRWFKQNPIMKIVRKNSSGESREVLLREYFVTASLIALLKRVGEEAARVAKGSTTAEPKPAMARVRR
jgi:hypothetical protein